MFTGSDVAYVAERQATRFLLLLCTVLAFAFFGAGVVSGYFLAKTPQPDNYGTFRQQVVDYLENRGFEGAEHGFLVGSAYGIMEDGCLQFQTNVDKKGERYHFTFRLAPSGRWDVLNAAHIVDMRKPAN